MIDFKTTIAGTFAGFGVGLWLAPSLFVSLYSRESSAQDGDSSDLLLGWVAALGLDVALFGAFIQVAGAGHERSLAYILAAGAAKWLWLLVRGGAWSTLAWSNPLLFGGLAAWGFHASK